MARGGWREGAGAPRSAVRLTLDVAYAEKLALLARLLRMSAPRRGTKAAQLADLESAVVGYLIDAMYEQVTAMAATTATIETTEASEARDAAPSVVDDW